jgi:hypothetical protein
MPVVTFRERERVADKLPPSLAQRVVPALQVRRLARSFAPRPLLRLRDHGPIRLPEVRVAGRFAPRRGDLLAQKTATLFTAVAQATGDPWARIAVQRSPHPGRLFLRAHKGPEFVQLQHRGGSRGRRQQSGAQGRESGGFFGSQLVTVLRETPKGRVRSRRLERSW